MPEPSPSGEESLEQLASYTEEPLSNCASLVMDSRSNSKGPGKQERQEEEQGSECMNASESFNQLKAVLQGDKSQVLTIPQAALAWPRQNSGRSDPDTMESMEKDGDVSDAASTMSHGASQHASKDLRDEETPRFMLPSLSSVKETYEVVAFQQQPVGSGLYTERRVTPGEANREKWLPRVGQGGFTSLDTPSMIAGQLGRFAADQHDYMK